MSLARPAIFSQPEVVAERLQAWSGTRNAKMLGAVLVLCAAGLVPRALSPFEVYNLTLAAVYLISAIGLNILTGYAGVISVGNAAFAMVGAYAVAITQLDLHLDFFVGIVMAIGVCGLIGLVTALPAVRLGGFAIAVVTLSYLSAGVALIELYPSVTGGDGGLPVRSSGLSPLSLWYVIGGLAFVVWVGARNAMQSPFGRSLTAGRLSPTLAASLGVSRSKGIVVAFVISACLAGLSGAMYPLLNGATASANFTVSLSILLLMMVIVGGEGTTFGPVVGVALLTGISYGLSESNGGQGGNVVQLVYGVCLLGIVLIIPRGVVGSLKQAYRHVRGVGPRPGVAPSNTVALSPRDSAPGLDSIIGSEKIGVRMSVTDAWKSIGGVMAVQGVSLTVEPGTVHGLIGPNGSGKTTLLNCISGFAVVDRGQVTLGGQALPRSSAARARSGLARTFQQPVLEREASSVENVLVGVDRQRSVSTAAYVLRLRSARREAAEDRRRARSWLRVVGLSGVADMRARELPPGQQRMLEIARALATRPNTLLLDEPAAGLNALEILELESLVRSARQAGIGVLLVEHHMNFVMRVCDEITVLAAGRVIAHGTPSEVKANAEVVEVYLGKGFQPQRTRSG